MGNNCALLCCPAALATADTQSRPSSLCGQRISITGSSDGLQHRSVAAGAVWGTSCVEPAPDGSP